MFRKKPPQLTTLEELRENYDDVVNLTLKNIMYEEQDRLEDALKGWKSLHTSLLFKIELFEKNLYKMSPEEADIFMELKSIRDQNVKHLIRVQLKLDATTKSRPVNKSSPQSNMTVPSLRNGMKNFHNPPKKKMVQSLRQNSGSGSSVSHGQKHQANLAANLSWQRPKKDELWGDFDQDFEIKDWEKIDDDGFVSDPEPNQEINLIDLDDNHVNKSLENLTLKPNNLYSSISNPNLSEKSDKSSRPLKKEKEKRSNGSLSPDNTYLRPPANKVSSSSDNSPNNSFKDKKYVYKQPQPMNINKLMKQTKKVHSTPQLHTTTTNGGGNNNIHSTNNSNQHKKPVKKSNIQYNYIPAKKPVKKDKSDQKKKDKSISPEPVSDISDEDNVTYVDPLLNPKVQDEIIKSIRGIDYNSGKQILNDIIVHGDEVYWDDIVGLDQAKSSLKEAVVYPFLRPDLFKGLREPIRGMLLFGPPGTGKTMLARAVATESKSTFFSITSSTITSKYLGESEKLVKAMFLLAKKLSPSIVFIDEIDSLLGSRTEGEIESIRRIKNEFLIQWSELSSSTAKEKDELDNQVLILGATNLPWSIDEAARRRFVKKQYIPLPEDDTRKSQILKLLKYQKNEISDDDFKQIIELTKKFSGSDITSLCKDSAMGPLRSLGELLLSTPTEEIRPVNLEDFKNSLKYIKPSVSEDSLKKYEEWSIKFGSGI